MRVALCLSGQTRSMERCLDSLVEHIVEPLDADVFFHFWTESITHPALDQNWYQLPGRPDWPPFEGDLACSAFQALKPRKFIVQPQLQFDDSAYQAGCTPENSRMQAVSFQHPLSMYYSIYMANHCKAVWEREHGFRYDCVIRCRTDMRFSAPLDAAWLADLSKMYIPEEHGYGGYNDQFAFSSSDNMDRYADCFNFIPIHFQRGGNFHPETILRRNIEEHALEVVGIPETYELVR